METKLPETINFPQEEENILKLWEKLDVFQNSLRMSKNKPKYAFYDGPPFATGLPHYGHILAGTIKDIVTRYAHQRGYHVERRFGWDTHGLPVEYEVDKTLGIKGPDDVLKMGIAKYNEECRNIVMRYSSEWEKVVTRIGRWIDFKNDYKTLYPWFMESVWWVFKELYNKGFVYQGVKVMPYSTGCNTPLSNFESGLNYKDVLDPSVVVAFPLTSESNTSILAWTTTPWTLPSNLALCCHPNFEYVKVKDHASGTVYILLESSLPLLYKSQDVYTIIGKIKGSELKGQTYEPLFPYYSHLKTKGAFRILNDTYVTADNGTGIVHQAPYFGEDDHRCCLNAGVITKDQEMICPIDSCGRFTEPVIDFLNKYVKEADKDIIKYLQTSKRLIQNNTVKHSYPYCWRSETPLIYKAVPSWFVRVETMRDKLLAANAETYWVPDYVKDKRFGNWLKDARDWAISRNRYWGTPIPMWISDDGQELICVGSIGELEKLTGVKLTDIHRENIDHLTIPSKRRGCPPLRRIPEVFDCWFESGSMPYAQQHYPFEREKEFDSIFPADFIAEGIDQTRGWFYTLLVISTALFGRSPFKNLVANGLVLASDGQKMSKSKKNYPDPTKVVDKFGADALRLYLINSPVVRAENLRFKEEGVRDIIKDVFLPWYNAFRFLLQNIERFEKEEKITYVYSEDSNSLTSNVLDKWIISFTQTLLLFLKEEMIGYRLYTVVPRLIKYIDNLTNWYVRTNRRRIKGESGMEDCKHALNTLFSVVYTMVRINSPFTPFLTEFMFQRLSKYLPKTEMNMESVHYQMIPDPSLELMDRNIERAVSYMQTIIELGRVVRDRKTIPVKYPLPDIVIIHQDSAVLEEIVSLKSYILEELNVKELKVTTDKAKYGVSLKSEPDHKTLGGRLKGEFKSVMQAIKELNDEQLQKFVDTKEIIVQGHKLGEEDLRLIFSFTGPAAEKLSTMYEAHSEGNILILLGITADESMLEEGLAREIINRVQKLRKKAKLVPSDQAIAYYSFEDASCNLAKVIVSHQNFIENTTKTPQKPMSELTNDTNIIIRETQSIKGVEMELVLSKDRTTGEIQSLCNYVNIEIVHLKPRFGAKSNLGTVLLQDPRDSKTFITYQQLRREIDSIFGIHSCPYDLYLDGQIIIENNFDVRLLDKRVIQVSASNANLPETKVGQNVPICQFVNVKSGSQGGTIILENPKGNMFPDVSTFQKSLKRLFGKTGTNLSEVSVSQLHGKTLQL